MEKIISIFGIENAYMLNRALRYSNLLIKYSTFKKALNLIRGEYELLSKRTRLKAMPYSIKLEPTNVCNLDCVFCDRKKINYGKGFISFEDFRKIFDQLKEHLYFCALELWGEPLLHKDICKIIRYAHDNKVATYISTNLNYLNDKLLEELINSGLDLLTVAVDGASQETYSKYRKNGNFELVVNNLKKLVEQKRNLKSRTPLIELQFIIFRYNEHEVGKIKRLAEEMGVDSLKLRPGLINDEEWIPKNIKYRYKQYTNKKRKRKTCWWLWRTASIGWNGDVFPCCRKVFDKPYGNMLKEDFQKIWNNMAYVESRKSFISLARTESQCSKCDVPFGNIHG